jgi:hypothetical protein
LPDDVGKASVDKDEVDIDVATPFFKLMVEGEEEEAVFKFEGDDEEFASVPSATASPVDIMMCRFGRCGFGRLGRGQ